MVFPHSSKFPVPPLRLVHPRCFVPIQRQYTTPPSHKIDEITKILQKPTWSVRSLLPNGNGRSSSKTVIPDKLRHLLRLSALPQPPNETEEKAMLKTLESQIHFVKEIQRIDTAGIPPLRSIRDESAEAVQEASIGLDNLKEAFGKERKVGRSKKIERAHPEKNIPPDDAWDGNALNTASKRIGKYFIVDLGD